MSNYDRIKAECYEANLLLPEFKLIDLTFGNVSVADRDQGVFAIKPSGVDYTQLSEADIVIIDMEGRAVEGTLRPSSDTPTHRRLFQAFPGIRAVVHSHSRNAVAFAQAGRWHPLPGDHPRGLFLWRGSRHPTHDAGVRCAPPTNGRPAMSSWSGSEGLIRPEVSKLSLSMGTDLLSPGSERQKKRSKNALALEIVAEMAL